VHISTSLKLSIFQSFNPYRYMSLLIVSVNYWGKWQSLNWNCTKVTTKQVEYGTHIEPLQTKKPPTLHIACPNIQYTSGMTLILTDPDAPSRDNPKWSEMCHWITIVPAFNSADVELDLTYLESNFNEVVECNSPST
jgi:hypothetical protein